MPVHDLDPSDTALRPALDDFTNTFRQTLPPQRLDLLLTPSGQKALVPEYATQAFERLIGELKQAIGSVTAGPQRRWHRWM